jgi:hypothetical protein
VLQKHYSKQRAINIVSGPEIQRAYHTNLKNVLMKYSEIMLAGNAPAAMDMGQKIYIANSTLKWYDIKHD